MNVNYEVSTNIATITIDRPDALNALNLDVLHELELAFNKADQDKDVYAVILTGAGRAFVAGADIGQMQSLSADEGRSFSRYGNRIFAKIEQFSKPVIAAVNGFALGGGCELACACDMRIAGEKAKFGQPEVSLGITPGFGGTQRLPRLVGLAKAKELIFTAATIDAQEAARIGLVSYVTTSEELMDKARELANKIAANAQIAVRQSKLAINNGMQCDMDTGLAFEAQAFGLCFSTQDQKDAMSAFINKEKVTSFKNK